MLENSNKTQTAASVFKSVYVRLGLVLIGLAALFLVAMYIMMSGDGNTDAKSRKSKLAVKEGKLELKDAASQDDADEQDDEGTIASKNKLLTLPGGVELELLYVEKGSFKMGSKTKTENETPHLVHLTRDYWLGKYEVTQEQWMALMGSNPATFNKGGRYPVESVSWKDAMEFCGKLTEMERSGGRLPEGYVYTLPTEAQWEFAAKCRGKYGDRNYSGGSNLDILGWHAGNSDKASHPVGRKRPNELGFHDMTGNVWEWCLDHSHIGAITNTYIDDISDPYCTMGSYRIFRGGSWSNIAWSCRVAFRISREPHRVKVNDIGFRVALASEVK